MSELTFGSLLAAYSLGFLAAIGAHAPALSAHGSAGLILLGTQYALISVTFAFLTAAFYVTYHAAILTMPQMPFERLMIDFTLAIIQALFFGISILRPWSFPILLGLNLYLTGRRQKMQHLELANSLFGAICQPGLRINRDRFKSFHQNMAKFLREDFRELSGWGPTGKLIWWGAAAMAVTGLIIAYFVADGLPADWPLRSIGEIRDNWYRKQALITFGVFLCALPILIAGWRVLERRAKFLGTPLKGNNPLEDGNCVSNSEEEEDLEMDVQFYQLHQRLKELCKNIPQSDASGSRQTT